MTRIARAAIALKAIAEDIIKTIFLIALFSIAVATEDGAMHLLHLLPPSETSPALPGPEGFVHLCWPSQVGDVVKRHFGGGPAIALVLDPAALDAKLLKEEDTYGHGAYPHYYGEISLEWVHARHVIAWVDDALTVDGEPASTEWK